MAHIMRLLHNNQRLNVIAMLIREGTVIPSRIWSTFPGDSPVYDGRPLLDYAQLDRDATARLSAAVTAYRDTELITVMVPLALPEGVPAPQSFLAGFTIMPGPLGEMRIFQSVLCVPRGAQDIGGSVTATFYQVPEKDVTSWDMTARRRRARTVKQ